MNQQPSKTIVTIGNPTVDLARPFKGPDRNAGPPTAKTAKHRSHMKGLARSRRRDRRRVRSQGQTLREFHIDLTFDDVMRDLDPNWVPASEPTAINQGETS